MESPPNVSLNGNNQNSFEPIEENKANGQNGVSINHLELPQINGLLHGNIEPVLQANNHYPQLSESMRNMFLQFSTQYLEKPYKNSQLHAVIAYRTCAQLINGYQATSRRSNGISANY